MASARRTVSASETVRAKAIQNDGQKSTDMNCAARKRATMAMSNPSAIPR
jgi:hypothetical protein